MLSDYEVAKEHVWPDAAKTQSCRQVRRENFVKQNKLDGLNFFLRITPDSPLFINTENEKIYL